MRVFDLTAERRGDSLVLGAYFEPANGPTGHLWFAVSGDVEAPHALGDPFVAALLPASMYEAEPLEIEAPVSQPLLDATSRVQNVLAGWYRDLKPIPVTGFESAESVTGAGDARGVACCFSGGVDSWYSLIENYRSIDRLLLIRGFDIATDNPKLWESTLRTVRQVADRFGKPLIVVSTNLRDVADKHRADWGRRYDGDFWGEILHGSALVAVGLLFGHGIGTLIVPATQSTGNLRPWGSSPRLDPRWSSERLVVRYDGGDATRLDKVRAFAGCDLALSTLRVCYHDPDRFNCCRCEKCIRTMMALRLCGALDRAVTFPEPLSLLRVRALEIPRRIRYYHECLLHAAEENGDEALGAALRAALGRTPSMSRLTLRGYRAIKRLSARAARAVSPRGDAARRHGAPAATIDKPR